MENYKRHKETRLYWGKEKNRQQEEEQKRKQNEQKAIKERIERAEKLRKEKLAKEMKKFAARKKILLKLEKMKKKEVITLKKCTLFLAVPILLTFWDHTQ